MPIRVRAKPPGEFIRDHLVAAGGIDYPQSIYKAYNSYLRSQGLKNGCNRASMSKYIWLANKMSLIQFDHAEAPAYWDGIRNGVELPDTYVRESRPQAPSPRHYYRIVDPNDDRWIRLEASYRKSLGMEVPPMAPRPPIRPPAPPELKEKPKAKVKPPPKPKKAKPTRKPPAVKPKPSTAAEKVRQYEEKVGLIIATLSELEVTPTLKTVAEIENMTLDLGEEVVKAARKAKGTERTRLSGLSLRLRPTLEDMPLLRSSVQRVLGSKTPTEVERSMASLRAAIRVVNENLTPLPTEVFVEETKEAISPQALIDKWEGRDKNILSLEKDLQGLDVDVDELNYVEDAISDYRGLERSDFDSQEEYREGRQEAWDTILEEIQNLAEDVGT